MELPVVKMGIIHNGQKIKVNMLLDTGSNRNILSTSLKLNDTGKCKESTVRTFDGTSRNIKTNNIIGDLISSDGKTMESDVQFVVTESIYEGIVGFDILVKYTLTFSLRMAILTSKNDKNKIFHLNPTQEMALKVNNFYLNPNEMITLEIKNYASEKNNESTFAFVGTSYANQTLPALVKGNELYL